MAQTILTSLGFKRKRYDDFIADMQQQARELWGADVNLSDNSPLGKFIKNISFARAEENELAEAIYYSAYYDTAEGVQLDAVCKNIGIQRIQAQKATGAVTLTVTPGITVNYGLIVATSDDVEFITTETVTDSDNDGSVSASIEAKVAGVSGMVPSNTITVINTPVVGVSSVTNSLETSGGRETETDSELRSRYEKSVSKAGASTMDGIKATLLNDVPDVISAVVIENNGDVADTDGRPPHSFEVITLGGISSDIGAAILKSKPAGIQAYGSQTVTVNDDSGNPQTIGFSYATEIDVYVNINLTANASFPSDGVDQVKLEVLKYIGGVDADYNLYSGLGMGDDVIITKIINAIYNVNGVSDASVTVSTDNTTFDPSNISISATQVAQTAIDRVVVTVA